MLAMNALATANYFLWAGASFLMNITKWNLVLKYWPVCDFVIKTSANQSGFLRPLCAMSRVISINIENEYSDQLSKGADIYQSFLAN